VRHPNANYVRIEVFCRIGRNFLYDKKADHIFAYDQLFFL